MVLGLGRQVRPAQTSSFSMYRPQQSGSLPMAVGAAQTGIDMSAMMNLMITMMIIGMMMKMMTGMMGPTTPKAVELAA